jgi:hypothetical protein
MAATATKNPITNLMYDWLTVLQNKAQAVAAYEKYLRDAEAEKSTECVAMLRKLHDQDVQSLEEVKNHVYGMIARSHRGT